MRLLAEAARTLIVGPARAVTPRVRVVIKYPNWYDHFQGLGFDLATGPAILDGIYTGTETRDPLITHQHLQAYHGYSILRYFDNVSPGRNGGGWVDTFRVRDLDRYVEQLWLTALGAAGEITLFNFMALLAPLAEHAPAPWQDRSTSFDHRSLLATPVTRSDAPARPPTIIARAAGHALEQTDVFRGFLGRPMGIVSYHRYETSDEDFLESYLGMLGIPIEMTPRFPDDDRTILLTESATTDPAIVDRIERRLADGKDVLITSGLLAALQGRGIERIAEIAATDRKVLASAFFTDWCHTLCAGDKRVLLPRLRYLTNDSWSIVDAVDGDDGSPLLISADYLGGRFFVLAIPDSFADLYHLPEAVLGNLREVLMCGWPVRVDGPAKVALFCNDNGVFVLESFRDDPVDVRLVVDPCLTGLRNLLTGEALPAPVAAAPRVTRVSFDADARSVPVECVFPVSLRPHSFLVLGS